MGEIVNRAKFRGQVYVQYSDKMETFWWPQGAEVNARSGHKFELHLTGQIIPAADGNTWTIRVMEGGTPGPPMTDVEAEERECWICLEEIECRNDCYGRCDCSVRPHCCLCGGSPYCDCCPKCGQCIADCGCPVVYKLQDGGEVIL